MWKPVPLLDGCYRDPSKPFSDQDVVNYWVEYAEGEGTRSPKKLVQLPGLNPFASFGAGPHRGARNVEGSLFVVADTQAYQVAEDGTATPLGTVPGRGLVWISHNQITNGYEVAFSTGPEMWIWNTVTSVWTKVTDEGFRGGRSLIYLNSRFLGIEDQRRFFANSALADGLSWDTLERYVAESAPDGLVALIDYGGEVYAFNARTLEIFQNTTNATDIANHILFTRIGSPVEIGAASPHAVSRLDNRIFLVSAKGAGYYMSGYTPVCITTPAIEKAWQDCDLSKAFCFTYESRGHAIWYVTFPDGHTWGYDCQASARAGRPIWHRRQTVGLDRWRLNTLVQWQGEWYGGSYNSGTMYRLDWDYFLDGCDELVRDFTPGVLHDEGNRVTLNGLRIECDTGQALSVCDEPEEQIPVVIDVLVMQAGGGFAFVNFDTATDTWAVQCSATIAKSFKSRPFMMGSQVIISYLHAGADTDAFVAYTPGSGTFATVAGVTHGARECMGIAKLSETRLVAFFRDSGVTNFTAQLYSWNGSAFALLDTLALDESKGRPDYLCSITHNGKAVFISTTGGKYVVITNTADVLSVVYSTLATVATSDACSNGSVIALSNGQMLTYNGTDMTLVQTTNDTTTAVQYDGQRFAYLDESAAIDWQTRSGTNPYTLAVQSEHYDSYPGASNGYVFFPSDSSEDYEHGVLKWNGAGYTRISDFDFDDWAPLSDIVNLVATVVRVS